MDTLYVLCRSVDRRHSTILDPTEATEAFAQKQAYFEAEAKTNPLVHEILHGGTVTCDDLGQDQKNGFFAGPATFFRTHEILRKTRSTNYPITIGHREFCHNDVAEMFDRCVPNAKLAQLPWFSLGRCRVSVALACGMTLLVAHIAARGQDSERLLDPFVVYYMGIITVAAALIYPIVKQNRDVRHSAPWNSAMYLDLNADLLRRNSPAVAMARKELIPREKPLKTPRFYYALARKIETHGFDSELTQRLPVPHQSFAAARSSVARGSSL